MKPKRRFMICFNFQLIIILKWKYIEGIKLILSVILFDQRAHFFYEIIKIALIVLNMKIIQKKFVFSLRRPVSKEQSYRLGKRMLQEINHQISKKVNECQ